MRTLATPLRGVARQAVLRAVSRNGFHLLQRQSRHPCAQPKAQLIRGLNPSNRGTALKRRTAAFLPTGANGAQNAGRTQTSQSDVATAIRGAISMVPELSTRGKRPSRRGAGLLSA